MAYRSSPRPKRSSYSSSSRGSASSCYHVPETPRPPQSYRDSAPDSQMPPTDSQLVSQRKQLAGTK